MSNETPSHYEQIAVDFANWIRSPKSGAFPHTKELWIWQDKVITTAELFAIFKTQ